MVDTTGVKTRIRGKKVCFEFMYQVENKEVNQSQNISIKALAQ